MYTNRRRYPHRLHEKEARVCDQGHQSQNEVIRQRACHTKDYRAAEGRISGAAEAAVARPLRAWAQHLLDPGRPKVQVQLDADKITRLWRQHQSGRYDRSHYLGRCIAFQAWPDDNEWLDGDIRP